jgi:predicted transcriptional regulator
MQVRLPDDFVKAVQHYAIDADKTVTQVVQEALQEYLAVRRKPRTRPARD